MGHKQMVIGGHDFTREQLFEWHPAHLVGLVLKYQETRRHWAIADQVVANQVEALEAELRAVKRERDGLKAELKHVRRKPIQLRRVA